MTLQNQIKIWIGIFLAGILALWVFRGILLPFILGLIFAYLLNPLVNYLQKRGLSRSWATAVVMFSVTGIIVGAFVMFVPQVVAQGIGLGQALPGYVTQLREMANEMVPALTE